MISMTDALSVDVVDDMFQSTPTRFAVYFIVLTAAIIGMTILFIYDIKGSVIGYRNLNVNDLGPLMPYAIGILPQLVQFVLAPLVVRAYRTGAASVRLLGIIWGTAFMVDAGTDYVFLLKGTTIVDHLTAMFIAVVVLTVFSDWFYNLSLAMWLGSIKRVFPGLSSMVGSIAGGVGVGETTTPTNRRNAPTNQPKRESSPQPKREQPHPENRTPPERRRI